MILAEKNLLRKYGSGNMSKCKTVNNHKKSVQYEKYKII